MNSSSVVSPCAWPSLRVAISFSVSLLHCYIAVGVGGWEEQAGQTAPRDLGIEPLNVN